MAESVAVAGWDELVDTLRDLPARMLARVPESRRDDPQIQQEIGRLALSALASSALTALAGNGDHPVLVPSIGPLMTVGQPNADTIYRTAMLTPGGAYRLRGKRGTARMVRIAQSGPPPKTTDGSPNLGPMRRVHDVNALSVDAEDRFDVILSPTRPEGYKGDWWELQPTSNKLLMRIVSSDWAGEVPPTIAIERLDVPATRPRPPASELEHALRVLAQSTAFIGTLFIDHVEQLRQEGYVNRLKVFDLTQLGGLEGQFYYEGAYDLADDEALIIEAKEPGRRLYSSVILTNDLYETTDWHNNHSSLNDAQAHADADGVLRVVVSAKDPGVPNWLDTAGYPTGAIQGRWTECDSQPIPSVRKIAVADVRHYLPPETGTVTPEQREAIIRERRAALQHRVYW